ncbi:carbohydrate-binding module family 18 protein [Piromyces sp. E2]|nr:carbohydrate-binding module family 18 protein [Piromyces sp. E2]|eukprot:OUM62016.1 carbohydrate-binding module family 18 protein [Piromyces sp. E2]
MKFILSVTLLVSTLLSNVNARWKPTKGLTWDYLLAGDDNLIQGSKKDVVTIDLEHAEKMVPILHSKGQKAVCYFSGGTMQKSRKIDYDDYVKAGVALPVTSSWGNQYIDIRKKSKLQPLIEKRMKRAYQYGCDAVEVDSLGVHAHVKEITENDTIVFATWLAQTAHDVGISIGLKNVALLAPELEPHFDFAVVESCAESKNVCNYYKAFSNNNKAVFIVHYGNRDWKLSGSKLNTLIKEQGGRGFTCVLSVNQDLNTYSTNYDCDTGAIINREVKKTITITKNNKATTTKTNTQSTLINKSNDNLIVEYSTDGRCGKYNGKILMCPNNSCCSKYGSCSYGDAFCGKGCQPAYGKCDSVASSPKIELSTDGRCGEFGDKILMCPNNSCCSKYGSCSYGDAFCGKGCQPAYGKCN